MSFEDIVAGLEFDDPTDVEDISKLSDFQLMNRMTEIDNLLKKRGEIMFPDSQRGRDLHSERAAIRILQLQRESK